MIKNQISHLNPQSSCFRTFFWLLTGALGILLVCALSQTLNRSNEVFEFMSLGWPGDAAQAIVQNKIAALWHASFMAAITAAVFAIFSFPKLQRILRFKRWIAAGLVLIAAADAAHLSRHYVKTLPRGYIEENAVTRLLKEQLGHQRVAMATQDGFYNIWLTYLFPYHQIPAFNITQMPRMPKDYKRFLETVGRNPLRMWQLCAVGFLLGPSEIEKQTPAASYASVLRYDVLADAEGGMTVCPNEKGSQAVLRCLAPAPRYALIAGCEKMGDNDALAKLSSNDWELFDRIILPPDSSQPHLEGHGFCGQVEVLEYRPGRVLLQVQADFPGFLRSADKYDPDWKATVDGLASPVLRADFIFQAVYVPAGAHQVELKYSPENQLVWLQFGGLAICALAAIFVILPKRKKHA